MVTHAPKQATVEQLFERIRDLESERDSLISELADYRQEINFIYGILTVDKSILKSSDKTAAMILRRQLHNKRPGEYHAVNLREGSKQAGIGYTTFQRSAQRLTDIGAISKRLTNFEHDGPNGQSSWTSEVAIKLEPIFSLPDRYTAETAEPIKWGGKRLKRCTNPKCNGTNLWKTTEVTCEDCGALLDFERIEINRELLESDIFQLEKSDDEQAIESTIEPDEPIFQVEKQDQEEQEPFQLDNVYTHRRVYQDEISSAEDSSFQVEKSIAPEEVDTGVVVPHIFQVEKTWEEKLANFANIPLEMQQARRWALFRYKDQGGKKPAKVPYIAERHAKFFQGAKSNDPTTWRSFDDVLTIFYDSHDQGWKDPFDGIMFASGDGWIGIDWDLDKETGELGQDAALIPTYTEYSPSGGVRQWTKGAIPQKRHLKDFEIYDKTQFLSVTGDCWENMPETVEECQEALTAMYEQVVPTQPTRKPMPVHPRVNALSRHRSDEEILELAMSNAITGVDFTRLWTGDYSKYATATNDGHSEADMALCGSLGYWWDYDAEAMDCMFRRSGLMRAKWDKPARIGETYGQGTIREVIERRQGVAS